MPWADLQRISFSKTLTEQLISWSQVCIAWPCPRVYGLYSSSSLNLMALPGSGWQKSGTPPSLQNQDIHPTTWVVILESRYKQQWPMIGKQKKIQKHLLWYSHSRALGVLGSRLLLVYPNSIELIDSLQKSATDWRHHVRGEKKNLV